MNIDKYKTENGYTSEDGQEYEDAEEFLQVNILGFCGCGRPEYNLRYIGSVLRHIHNLRTKVWTSGIGEGSKKEYSHWEEEGKKIGTIEQLYLVYYFLDTVDLTEHGGAVPGWLTDKGMSFMEDIEELYYGIQPIQEIEPMDTYLPVSKAMIKEVIDELMLFRRAAINNSNIPVGRIKDCGCLGPLPECACMKREELVKNFIELLP